MRVEADLVKAAVDQLIPGWVKARGPCRASCPSPDRTARRPKSGICSSTAVRPAARHRVAVGGWRPRQGGPLDFQALARRRHARRRSSAPAATTRCRAGQCRRRPALRQGGRCARRRLGSGERERRASSKDFDLDLDLNILTGFNDEAITNAAVKASVRKDTIRQLDFKGRLGATNLIGADVCRLPAARP